MREKRTAGYTERLGAALERGPRPMSVRALAQEMGERYPGLRGTSYGGVRQYAEGKVRNARVDLLRAFADVLGVRGDWLAFGEGEMTHATSPELELLRDRDARLHHALQRGLHIPVRHRRTAVKDGIGGQVATSHAAAVHLWRMIRNEGPIDMGAEQEDALMEEIGRALRSPLEAIGTSPAALSPGRLEDYIMGMVAVLAPVVRAVGGPLRMKEVERHGTT